MYAATILLFTVGSGFRLFALIMPLFTRAIIFKVVDFTLLLLKGLGNVGFEKVVLDLDLLSCV